MNAQPVIMVQVADPDWTLEAVHCACRTARQASMQIILMQMIPVQFTQWLGTEAGYVNFSHQERVRFAGYKNTIEDYGLDVDFRLFQYSTWVEGTTQAAAYASATIVFAKQPTSRLSFWARFQTWQLKGKLDSLGCTWINNPTTLLNTDSIQFTQYAATY